MENLFIPSAAGGIRAKELEEVCDAAGDIYDIASGWVGCRKKMIVCKGHELPFECVMISFLQQGKLKALACIPGASLLGDLTYFPDGEILTSREQRREWFLSRNNKLGIYTTSKGLKIGDRAALNELTSLYAASENGLVRITSGLVDLGQGNEPAFKGVFYYLDGDTYLGWREEITVPIKNQSERQIPAAVNG